ncbi:MAG: hypothetical protein ACRD3S_17080, partial [Terracidiphilus sp.]
MRILQKAQGRWVALLVLFSALAFLAARVGRAQEAVAVAAASRRVVLYVGVGDDLAEYEADVDRAILIKRSSVTLPGTVGEGWAHPSRKYLYVPWSNRARRLSGLSAFSIDPISGALSPDGEPATLPSSASYVTGDISGTHLLVSYGNPAGVTVHRIAQNGAIGSQVEQGPLDVGIVGHQVRVNPSNTAVILVTRGNYTDEQYPNLDSPRGLKILQPGALKIFSYKDGVLANQASIAPGGGFGFQARHLDFHPSQPWVFLTLEPQNKLYVYKEWKDGTLSSEPLFIKETLADPANVRPMQHTGTI